MSDPVGYIALNVIGPDTAEALRWFDRELSWECRLRELREHPERPSTEPVGHRPPNAA